MNDTTASLALLNLLGSVALLLWGLRMVRTAAERSLGSNLDRRLRQIAGGRVRALLFGGAAAAMLQSSTAVVLLGAGFVAKARLLLPAGLAIALGADVGSAVSAQILTMDIREISPGLILIGYALFQLSSTKRIRHLGRALIGLGLMLFALGQIVGMSEAIRGSTTVPVLISALSEDPVLAILAAALLTWLAHSSLAIVLLIASLAHVGTVTGSASVYLLLGANLGAALPALAASMGETMPGRRVAIGNLLFRSLGVLTLSFAAQRYFDFATAQGLDDKAIVVLGHLGFNVIVALASLPFVGLVADFLERAFPGAAEIAPPRAVPRYLDHDALGSPSRALGNARRESVRLADLVQEMLDNTEESLAPGASEDLPVAISRAEDDVDMLNSAIKFYVTELTREPLSHDESRQAHTVISFSTNMEHIADIMDRNIRRLADRKRKAGLRFSDEGAAEITDIFNRLREAMQTAVAAFMADDEELAEQIIAEKRSFRDEEQLAYQQHLERLREGNVASIDTSAIHLDLLRDLKRVHSHLTSIAYTIAERDPPEEGESGQAREGGL